MSGRVCVYPDAKMSRTFSLSLFLPCSPLFSPVLLFRFSLFDSQSYDPDMTSSAPSILASPYVSLCLSFYLFDIFTSFFSLFTSLIWAPLTTWPEIIKFYFSFINVLLLVHLFTALTPLSLYEGFSDMKYVEKCGRKV